MVWKVLIKSSTHRHFLHYTTRDRIPMCLFNRDKGRRVHTKTCKWMFLEALFIVAPHWKQLECPSSGEWTNQQRPSRAKEYYPAIKRTELWIPTTPWAKSKVLSEVARCQSYILYYSIYITSFERQTMKRKIRLVIAKPGNQARILPVKGQEEFWEVMETFCILITVVIQLYTFVKTPRPP